jgi:hypothetical protein
MPYISLKIILFAFVASLVVKISDAQTYTFTNAGATGREGPTQEQIDANYSGTNLDGKVTINTQGIQEWVVPAAGNYSIEAYGAQGGSAPTEGGKGAFIKGSFLLSKGEILKLVIGQMGESNYNNSAGGGGGSYVIKNPYDTNDSILIIAGGGGGSAGIVTISSDANASNNGNNAVQNVGYPFPAYGGAGGQNGSGGVQGKAHAGNGGGFFTNGDFSYTDRHGMAFVNGSEGGEHSGGRGGFGGGGSAGSSGGWRWRWLLWRWRVMALSYNRGWRRFLQLRNRSNQHFRSERRSR